MSSEGDRPVTLRVRPRTVGLVMLAVLAVLWIPGAIGVLAEPSGGIGRMLRRLNFDGESNIPAYWQSLTLFGLCLAAAVIAAATPAGRERREWLGVAGAFAYVAVDEAETIHERLVNPVSNVTGAKGVLHFAWLIPAFVVLALLAVIYLRWYLRLERRLRRLLTAALALYLLGAVIGEMIGGELYESGGPEQFGFRLETQLEELCESLGVIVAAFALVEEISRRSTGIEILVEGQAR